MSRWIDNKIPYHCSLCNFVWKLQEKQQKSGMRIFLSTRRYVFHVERPEIAKTIKWWGLHTEFHFSQVWKVLPLEYCSNSRKHIVGNLLKLAFHQYPFYIFSVKKCRGFGMAKPSLNIPKYFWSIPAPVQGTRGLTSLKYILYMTQDSKCLSGMLNNSKHCKL